MTCNLWRDKLDAYVDSSCSQDDLAGLEAHFRACPSCAAEALSRLRIKKMTQVAAAGRYTPSVEFRLRLKNAVKEKSQGAERKPSWAFLWIPRMAVLGIAIVLLVVGLTLWSRHAARDWAVAELVDLHVATLASANPVDVISTDRHTVKPWFQGKLPFTFNLPELQNSPFKLLGGKVMYFDHSPGAELLFQIRSHQLSIFVMQDRPDMMPAAMGVHTAREMAFNVETWSDGGLRYVVIGDASPADVRDLSELMRTAK